MMRVEIALAYRYTERINVGLGLSAFTSGMFCFFCAISISSSPTKMLTSLLYLHTVTLPMMDLLDYSSAYRRRSEQWPYASAGVFQTKEIHHGYK